MKAIIDKLKNLLKLKSENDIEIHLEEVRKRGSQIRIGDNEYQLSDFDTFEKEILEGLKQANSHDLEDLVFRMQLAYDEFMEVLDIKYFPSKGTGYTLPPGIYEICDINKTLKCSLPDIVKVSTTIDNIRLKSILNINQTLIFTKKSIFYTLLGFTQSNSGPLGDIDGYIQLIPGKYRSIKPINITGNDKVHLKCDCVNGSIVDGCREPKIVQFWSNFTTGP